LDIKIIGLGGIGSILANQISRFLNYSTGDEVVTVTLVDGDTYEERNAERQEFIQLGKKATVKQNELAAVFRNIDYKSCPEYVDEDLLYELIDEGDIVFIAVDNHKTRKIISDHAKTLDDILVISGGNELVDGNVQIYARKEGKDVTPSLTDYHPEINEPSDKLPSELSCEELAKAGEPQLLFTNLSAATLMCWAFFNSVVRSKLQHSEVYFDIPLMKVDPKSRQTTVK